MLVKRGDENAAQADTSLGNCNDRGSCPPSLRYVNLGGICGCLYFPAGWKRDNAITPEQMRVPFDPHVYCENTMKGHCPGGTSGLWSQHDGKCYCGAAKAVVDLVTREEQDESRIPHGPQKHCFTLLKDRCADGNIGLWDRKGGLCYCGPASIKSPAVSAAVPTTAEMLTGRLMPGPHKFPTGISNTDWTAIEVALVLLDDSIKTHSTFHEVCTGAKDPQAFGFELSIFRKLCTPEITMPVTSAEIQKAKKKVYSALFIDTKLQKHNGDFPGACEEAKSNGTIPSISTLDKEYITSQLCRCAAAWATRPRLVARHSLP